MEKLTHVYIYFTSACLLACWSTLGLVLLLISVLFLKPSSQHRVTMCSIFRRFRSPWDYKVSDIHPSETQSSLTHLIGLLLRIRQVREHRQALRLKSLWLGFMSSWEDHHHYTCRLPSIHLPITCIRGMLNWDELWEIRVNNALLGQDTEQYIISKYIYIYIYRYMMQNCYSNAPLILYYIIYS